MGSALGSVREVVGLVCHRLLMPPGPRRDSVSLALLARVRDRLIRDYPLGDVTKSWPRDAVPELLGRFPRQNERAAERRFFVRQLAASLRDVPGDTAEAGVYDGATSYFICTALGRRHHGFDSFEGVSPPGAADDAAFWSAGDLSVPKEEAERSLAGFDAHLYQGWIPGVFEQARIDRLCFAHIDVDLYQPTLDSMEFFYPRLSLGGILVCDDYGFETCPGVRRAVDEYMSDKPDVVIEAPTAQAIVIRRAPAAGAH